MELKVGNRFVLKKELTLGERKLIPYFYIEMEHLLGQTFELLDISPYGNYGINSEVDGRWYINPQWIDWEETMKLNKIKMVIGENVYANGYKIGGFNNSDIKEIKEIRDCKTFYIKDSEGNCIYTIELHKHNYKQQMEIINMILDKLGLNVELVEENNSEVLEQIRRLEAELKKLRGMIR